MMTCFMNLANNKGCSSSHHSSMLNTINSEFKIKLYQHKMLFAFDFKLTRYRKSESFMNVSI